MKPKFYHAHATCTDSKGERHVVTVVGKLEQNRRKELTHETTMVETKPNAFTEGVLIYEAKKLHRKLTLGMSICHPLDTFDEEIGVKMAKSRIEQGNDLGQLETSNVTMLTKDAIMAEIIVKLNHIVENIEEFLP